MAASAGVFCLIHEINVTRFAGLLSPVRVRRVFPCRGIGSNRLAIMVATGTARKPNDHELDVAKNDMKLISNATANKPALTHMPLRL